MDLRWKGKGVHALAAAIKRSAEANDTIGCSALRVPVSNSNSNSSSSIGHSDSENSDDPHSAAASEKQLGQAKEELLKPQSFGQDSCWVLTWPADDHAGCGATDPDPEE